MYFYSRKKLKQIEDEKNKVVNDEIKTKLVKLDCQDDLIKKTMMTKILKNMIWLIKQMNMKNLKMKIPKIMIVLKMN